jgi:multisubunit Na+/H+ antiporter MnhC subunit
MMFTFAVTVSGGTLKKHVWMLLQRHVMLQGVGLSIVMQAVRKVLLTVSLGKNMCVKTIGFPPEVASTFPMSKATTNGIAMNLILR